MSANTFKIFDFDASKIPTVFGGPEHEMSDGFQKSWIFDAPKIRRIFEGTERI